MVVITRGELECLSDALHEVTEDFEYKDMEVVAAAKELVEALIGKCEQQSQEDLEAMFTEIEKELWERGA